MDTKDAIKKSITRTTGVVACATLISKILSYVTAIAIGAKFGVTRLTDAYLISLIIPDFLILIFGTPLGLGLTTLLTENITKGNEKQNWELIGIISTLLLVIFLFISTIMFFLNPWLSSLLTSGFDNNSRTIVAKLNRVALGYMFFVGLAHIPRSILHSYRRFIIPAITPGLLQVIVLFSIIFYSKRFHILSINIGLFWGGFFCFILLIFSLRNKMREFNFRLRWNIHHPELNKILNLIYPLLLYCIVFQVNTGVDRIVASRLKAGSVAALDFAFKVNWMFLPVLAGALFTVILPIFSEQVTLKKWDNFKETLNTGIRLLNFLITPISIFIMFMATPLIKLLFERGAFNAQATLLTSQALVMYSLGSIPFVMLHVVSCALIALGDSRSITKISSTLILLNLVLDLILSRYLGHMGIALGTSLVSIFGFWFYARALRRKVDTISILDMFGSITKIIFASFIMALVSLFAHNILGIFINTTIFRGQLIQMGTVICIALCFYLWISYALGIKEEKELFQFLKTK